MTSSLQSKVKPANGSAPGGAPQTPSRSGAEGLPSFTQSTLESLVEKQECAPCGSFWRAIGNFFSALFNWFIGLFTSSEAPSKDEKVKNEGKEERKDDPGPGQVDLNTPPHTALEPTSASTAGAAASALSAGAPAASEPAGESAPHKALSVAVPDDSVATDEDVEAVFHDDETPPAETKSEDAGSSVPKSAREFVDKWRKGKLGNTAEFYRDFDSAFDEAAKNKIKDRLLRTTMWGRVQTLTTTPRSQATTPRKKLDSFFEKKLPLRLEDMQEISRLLFPEA